MTWRSHARPRGIKVTINRPICRAVPRAEEKRSLRLGTIRRTAATGNDRTISAEGKIRGKGRSQGKTLTRQADLANRGETSEPKEPSASQSNQRRGRGNVKRSKWRARGKTCFGHPRGRGLSEARQSVRWQTMTLKRRMRSVPHFATHGSRPLLEPMADCAGRADPPQRISALERERHSQLPAVPRGWEAPWGLIFPTTATSGNG